MSFLKWLILTAFLIAPQAEANSLTIFDVRRPVALSDSDNPPRDFYINGGGEDGLKAGMVVDVYRQVSLYDAYQDKSAGELKVEIGRLKIIHVQKDLSVGRLDKIYSRKNRPVLKTESIMIGDELEHDSSSGEGESDNANKQKKTSSQPAESKKRVHELKAGSESLASKQPATDEQQRSQSEKNDSTKGPVLR